jgi:hypothetical protein
MQMPGAAIRQKTSARCAEYNFGIISPKSNSKNVSITVIIKNSATGE